jgi:phytoene dehydrogenase-like protein
VAELFRLIRARSFRRFGLPPVGNSQLAEALGEFVEQRGGNIITNAQVTEISIDEGRVRGVKWVKDGREEEARCSHVINNAGTRSTVALAGSQWFPGEELERIEHTKASHTLIVEIFSDHALVDFPGILMLPAAKKAAFIACPSLICPQWAPEGKHLTIVLGPPSRSEEPFDGKKEFELILEDAGEFLPGFDREAQDWIMRSFRGDWPGFRARPGHGFGTETPVDGLFNVGDSVNPSAVFGVGGCAESARSVADKIISSGP